MALEPKGALFDDFIFFELSAEQSSIPPENARRRGFVAIVFCGTRRDIFFSVELDRA